MVHRRRQPKRREQKGRQSVFPDGYEFQHRGIASMICDKLEKQAKYKITVEASITAKGFFLKRGYAVVKEQTVFRREVALINYLMEKQIGCIK